MPTRARRAAGFRGRSPSYILSTTDAVILKDGDLFFLSERDGMVPLGGRHGFGLFYHDCRFLSGYLLTVGGIAPERLTAESASSYRASFELTNPQIPSLDGGTVENRRIGIKLDRLIESGKLALLERITFRNFDIEAAGFQVSLQFEADFQDIFIIHGAKGKRTGKPQPPVWQDGALRFTYKGVDNIYRGLAIYLSQGFEPLDKGGARFDLHLEPGEFKVLHVSQVISESPAKEESQARSYTRSGFDNVADALDCRASEWAGKHTEVGSDSRILNESMARSLADHLILRSALDKEHYFAGGLPWFCALFGRDSLLSALQMLIYSPGIAEQTLRLLARFQGRRIDPTRDEEPGKIHHELRMGELAHSNQIAQTPYYGTVDATPLFIILLCEHAAWTGDLTLFTHLKSNIEAAINWIDHFGDLDGDGYTKYVCRSKKGLANQGWKDSGNSMVTDDGSLAEPPIALAEVQGYVFMAKTSLADLYRRCGDAARADQLLEQAARLRSHFNQDFWLQEKCFYAMALQKGNRPLSVISSNPGQALWSGIVDPNRAKLISDRLMREDMFSGWGIRTLSSQERRYNPIGYHLGTVWPHDNSIIAAGFRRYGLDQAFVRVFDGTLEAASHFDFHRLPELFSGYDRREYSIPVPYPEACHPQVWAAGTIPFMVQTALGLTPVGFDRRLRIIRPILPGSIQSLQIHRLKVASASVDLRFDRTAENRAEVKILKKDGDLDVSIERG